MASAIDDSPVRVLVNVKLRARAARAEREPTWVACGGDEREGAHRGAPQHSGISAFVPGGRHAGELAIRGTLAAL